MSFPRLPGEIMLLVARHMDSERDINACARTNRHFYNIFNSVLYRYNWQYSGGSAIHWALDRNQETTVQKILGYCADISPVSPRDKEAVNLAAEHGREDVLRFLLANIENDPTMTREAFTTALVPAVKKGNHQCIRLLFKCDAIPWHESARLLELAADRNDIATLKLVLSLAGPGSSRGEVVGLLSNAIHKGNEEVFDALMTLCYGDRMRDLAAIAAYVGRLNMLKKLIEKGADPNLMVSRRFTTLTAACDRGHEHIVKYLLSLDHVDRMARARGGQTALHLAVLGCHESIVRLLLEDGSIEINARSLDGCTALIYAAGSGNEAIVRLLLAEPGIDIAATSQKGSTALSLAAKEGHLKVLALLLERNAGSSV